MTITIRPARTANRVIVESDGCSDYYDGALVQGATVCRISAPASLVRLYIDANDELDLRAFLHDLDSKQLPALRVRVLERRTVS